MDNVSVAEVMSAADMTIGGFYKHFESKDALVEEVFSLTFEQSSATWRQVSERKYDDPGLRSAAIVDYYLKKKAADQACPMIAFASHVTAKGADESSRGSYRKGTEALYAQFLDHMARSADGESSDQEAKILFAASKASARPIKLGSVRGANGDPAALRDAERQSTKMKELGERFLNQYVPVRCKPSTQAEYRRSVELFLDPFFAKQRVRSVTTADVAEFHGSLSHIPYQANRTLGVLSKMMRAKLPQSGREPFLK